MSEENNNEFILPSDPAVRKAIRDAVTEASNVLTMIEGQKEALKAIVSRVKEDLEVPKRTFNKMVKTFHKQEYAAVVHENEVFQVFYENIMEDKT